MARWRKALIDADWTVEAVARLLGSAAMRAIERGRTVPALRATGDGSALSTLTRLWTLQAPVPTGAAERALPGLVDRLCVAGVLQRSVGEVAAAVDVRPYADEANDWWVVADLTPGLDGRNRRMRPDHVLGVSSASTSLAQLTVRHPVTSALDLGTGSGVQALHLSTHATRVVATDVNRRALGLARLTVDLNEVDVELREGDLLEPATGETYDLIVTNPPFVISPGTGERLVYRDSGLPGDYVVEHIVRTAPKYLAPAGRCQVLANWAHLDGQPWSERVTAWLSGSGCDAWVLQREVTDLPAYVEMWLADAGITDEAEHAQRYDTWLSWFAEQGIEAVGFGWLSLQRTDREEPVVRCEDWPYEVTQPLGPAVAAWSSRTDALARLDEHALLRSRLLRPAGVVQEQSGEPGAADPQHIVLRLGTGVRRARRVDTDEAALVGACDGDLTVGQILDAIAELQGAEPAAVRAQQLPRVRELVADGFLQPDITSV
ncbi:MAG: Putative methyltransferase SCO3545 [uncultured Nocardioidaceae bacterium]|uniref:Methyltransferase SCO3545 n=1 Tax=uncultured Nocardioidaceae bacterium TaxID=253824 RepID=A0A6J4LXM4_9ACTN|nr:MAG: Putative methyltransferase SCO3545 [uncultured Nocardioidaceae bacterium]